MWQFRSKYALLPSSVEEELERKPSRPRISRTAATMLVIFLVLSYAWIGLPTPILNHRQSTDDLNPYPSKPRICFKNDGTFKLTVFSDLHFGENPWEDWGPEQDRKSLIVMSDMIKLEQPDFVAINGDLITGENTFRENSTALIDQLTGPLTSANVPFGSAYGNHDNHVNITHLEEIEREQLVAPTSYSRRSPPGVGGEGGEGNYWVPIYSNQDAAVPSLIVWFFDSRSGFSQSENPVGLPDWVDESVADWLRSEVALMESVWGPSETRAALAFVHIPFHVMESLQPTRDPVTEPGLDGDHLGQGSTQSTINTSGWGDNRDVPFFKTLASTVKNLHAVVSGHDHGNEWCVREPATDQVLCFNKHTGYGGYGQPGWGHGVRNFLFTLQNLTTSVESWVTMEDGSVIDKVVLDSSYGRK